MTMGVRDLRGSAARRRELARPGACSRAQLLLEEVRESGVPAYFFEYGEHLMYLDGELYDLSDVEAAADSGAHPLPLPRQILENGVGLEYGWRHKAGCVCPHCRAQAPAADHREAVA